MPGSFATTIRTYRRPVIVGFGHEMNAQWSLWGYRHDSPRTFVAAWRHIVDVLRRERVRNVTWTWTINVIDAHSRSLPPRPLAPILISETGVAPEAGKSAKIGNLFGGVRAYGLLGLVWFDAVAHRNWGLDNKAAIDAFRRAARSTLELASADSTVGPRLLAGGGRR